MRQPTAKESWLLNMTLRGLKTDIEIITDPKKLEEAIKDTNPPVTYWDILQTLSINMHIITNIHEKLLNEIEEDSA